MAPRLTRVAVVLSWALSLAAVASELTRQPLNEADRHLGVRGASGVSGQRRATNADEAAGGRAEKNIVVREGILFQTEGCPQVMSEQEAYAKAADESIPGNIISLISEGKGRAGNHFLVISDFFAMAYCCKTKVLQMPRFDQSFPPGASGDSDRFEAVNRFFDFSGVDRMPLDEYEGLSKDPLVCKPHFDLGGRDAIYLRRIHADLLSCMNRVYVRGCEAAYLEPILDAEIFSYCEKPGAAIGRQLSDENGAEDPGTAPRRTPLPLTSAAGVPTSEEIQTALEAAGEGTRAPGSAPLTRESTRTGQPESLSGSRTHDDGVITSYVRHAIFGDGDSTERSDGVPLRDGQAPGLSEGSQDVHRRLQAATGDEGEVLVGGGVKLSRTSSQAGNDGGEAGIMSRISKRGSAGSLVIHIRSGDIFHASFGPDRTPGRAFLSYGQPPLQFYLLAIASQPWSDVTILTYCSKLQWLNPTFAALEMLQKTGILGAHVTTHKDRDLLTDIRSMLCADGLAISRSTLHFLTFAHTRAKHLMVPSACGPGSYARGYRDDRDRDKSTIKKKPNPNNTTLLCAENPDAEVYGVDWEVNEAAYSLYDKWDASPAQRQKMVLFDGIKGLSRCCPR